MVGLPATVPSSSCSWIFQVKLSRIQNTGKITNANALYALLVSIVSHAGSMVTLVLTLMKLIGYHIFSPKKLSSTISRIIEFIDSQQCRGRLDHGDNLGKSDRKTRVITKKSCIWKSCAQLASMVSASTF